MTTNPTFGDQEFENWLRRIVEAMGPLSLPVHVNCRCAVIPVPVFSCLPDGWIDTRPVTIDRVPDGLELQMWGIKP